MKKNKGNTEGWSRHTFLYPYATVTFGFTSPYVFELRFEHRVNIEGEDELNILGLISTDEFKVEQDAGAMVGDPNSTYTQFIINNTLANFKWWDEKDVWWC